MVDLSIVFFKRLPEGKLPEWNRTSLNWKPDFRAVGISQTPSIGSKMHRQR